MSHEHNEETNGQSKAAESSIASRKKMLVIAALLLVAAAAGLGYWFIGSANRSSVAGRPVHTPDFDVIPPSPGAATSGEAPRPGGCVDIAGKREIGESAVFGE